MAFAWYKFSGCCNGTTFQSQINDTPTFGSVGNSFYAEFDIYSGCTTIIGTGYDSGYTISNFYLYILS